jgi:rubrerythrin
MTEKMKGSEWINTAIDTLKNWQVIEKESIETCANIMERTDNAVIREVMEIIRNDSLQHHRVQQFIIDSFTKESVSLTPEEMGEIWSAIEKHDEVERQTIDIAKNLLEDCNFPVQRVLLEYLLTDEQKHDALLSHLDQIKKGMYPYGS